MNATVGSAHTSTWKWMLNTSDNGSSGVGSGTSFAIGSTGNITLASGANTLYARLVDSSDNVITSANQITRSVTLEANTIPTITDITNQTTTEGIDVDVTATIADTTDIASLLTLTADSSNPTLLPTANITFAGTTGTRTITLSPATGQYGTTNVTITVSDGTLTVQDSFILTVDQADTDGDGYSDAIETAAETSPIDASDFPKVDLSDRVDAEVGTASGLDTIEANLKLWLDASNIDATSNTTLADGDAIGEWIDLSGNGSNMAQLNSAYQPTYTANGVVFSQIDDTTNHDHLYVENVLDETSYDYTIIAIIDPGTDTDFVIFGQSEISGSDDVNHYYSYNNTGKFNVDEYSPYGGGVFLTLYQHGLKMKKIWLYSIETDQMASYHFIITVKTWEMNHIRNHTQEILIYTQYLEQELLVGHFQNWIMH